MMDAVERARLRDEMQNMRTQMEECHVHGITLPSSFAWRLHVISTNLLDALDAAEARLAAVDKFIAERAEVITAIKNCPSGNEPDYWRWQGHAEARRVLAEDLAALKRGPEGAMRDAD